MGKIKDKLYSYCKDNNYKVIDDYVNGRTRITIEDINGYRYFIVPSKVERLCNARPFYIKNKYAMYNIKLYISKNDIKHILVSDDFNEKNKLVWMCSKCKKKLYESSWERVYNGYKNDLCEECTDKKMKSSRRSAEDLYAIMSEKGYYFDKKDYINVSKKIRIWDKDGYQYFTSLNHAKRGDLSPFFHNNKYIRENIMLYFKNKKKNVKIVDSYTLDGETLFVCICSKCGEKYVASWASLKRSDRDLCDKHFNEKISLEISKRLSTDFNIVKNKLLDMGYYINESDYYSINKKAFMVGTNGYKYYSLVCELFYGKSPDKFNPSNPYSCENINNYLMINGSETVLISKEYKNCDTKMDWKCQCGKIYKATWDSVKQGSNLFCKSCCSNTSKYELKVIKFLEKNKVLFSREYPIDNPMHRNGNHKLRYDFYLKEIKIFIEVDGEMHFDDRFYVSKYGEDKGFKMFNKRQLYDKYKNQWCEDNNIPLLRIPYYEFKNDNYKKIIIDFINSNSNLKLEYEEG